MRARFTQRSLSSASVISRARLRRELYVNSVSSKSVVARSMRELYATAKPRVIY